MYVYIYIYIYIYMYRVVVRAAVRKPPGLFPARVIAAQVYYAMLDYIGTIL